MQSLKDFIYESEIDNSFENILLEDLGILILCLQKTTLDNFFFESKHVSNIFESLSQLDNFKEVYKLLRIFWQKLPNDFEEKEYTIDLRKAKTICNEIKLDLKKSDEGNTAKYNKLSADYSMIYIEVRTKDHRKNSYNTSLCGLILHELLHAYEDICRKKKNKPSIYDEFTNKYDAGFANLKNKDFVVKNLAVLNYFLNPKERRAYLSTIELDILEVIKEIRPTFSDMRTDKVLKRLQQTGIWKTYFNFGKFVMFIDKIDDKILERAYYNASKTTEEKNKDIDKRIAELKTKTKVSNTFFIKSSKEIREECKKTWNKFNTKFNSVFVKVYNEVVSI